MTYVDDILNKEMDQITLEDGKYRLYEDLPGIIKADRHGEYWRDFIGDKAVYALFSRAVELEKENEKLKSLILLTDPSVSNVEMNDLTVRQFTEFNRWKEET